jgi:hypothetical protein
MKCDDMEIFLGYQEEKPDRENKFIPDPCPKILLFLNETR